MLSCIVIGVTLLLSGWEVERLSWANAEFVISYCDIDALSTSTSDGGL